MGVFWFLVLVGVGTTVFKVYGHMSLIDAFYLTVVSSSTVGYGALVFGVFLLAIMHSARTLCVLAVHVKLIVMWKRIPVAGCFSAGILLVC